MSRTLAFRSVLFLLALSVPVWGQSADRGSIDGSVTDTMGAVLPGAVVTARNVSTSLTLTVKTENNGRFQFLVIPVGSYEVAVEYPGFAKLVQRNIVVTVGSKVSLGMVLGIAPRTESIEVSDPSSRVETSRTHVSSTIGESFVSGLPANGRNFMEFIALTPGVVKTGGISFGGQRTLNVMLVDGADNNFRFSGEPFLERGPPFQYSLEVVREFQVNTSSYPAEFGRAGNGLVSVVTKSGTNQFHGDLFWYFRDQAMNATDLIRKINHDPKEPLHIHQFGGTVGGPIRRDRLFFFASYDGQRRKEQNATSLILPSGFQLSSDPDTAAYQQRALDYLEPRALPWLRGFNQDVYFVKVDWYASRSQLWTARWNTERFRGHNSGLAGGETLSEESAGDADSANDTFALSHTLMVSPSTINVARFSYLRQVEPRSANSVNPSSTIQEAGVTLLSIGRATSTPQRSSLWQLEWSDTLSIHRASHSLKMGLGALVARATWSFAPNFSGNYRFTSLASFGRSLAQLPVCPALPQCRKPQPQESYVQAFSGEGKPGAIVHPDSVEFSGFAQDEWRIADNFTLNFGLRYDVQLMARQPVKNESPALAAAGLSTDFVPFDGNNFAPRLGFAWSPVRSQRLVVRGGYGMFYAWARGAMVARTHLQNGVTVRTRTFGPGYSSFPAYPNTLCGPPNADGTSPSCPAPATGGKDTLMLFSPGYVQPYDQHASLGLEYELHRDVTVSASYVLVKGTHLQRWRDVNYFPPTNATIGIANTNTILTYSRFGPAPPAPPARPVAEFDRILALESTANSFHQGMTVQVRKRPSKGFQFLVSYTLGRVIDDAPEALVFNPGGAVEAFLISDSSNPRADRGPGLFDARHRFVVSGVWQLDYARRLSRAARALLSGWEVSGIFAAQSGLPYSARVNADLNNDGNVFADRPPGEARNAHYLPATVSLDPRLTRNVRLTERYRLQLIWEAFNVLNGRNVSGVRNNQYSQRTSLAVCGVAGSPCLVPLDSGVTAFGTPNSTTGPRVMQLAARLQF